MSHTCPKLARMLDYGPNPHVRPWTPPVRPLNMIEVPDNPGPKRESIPVIARLVWEDHTELRAVLACRWTRTAVLIWWPRDQGTEEGSCWVTVGDVRRAMGVGDGETPDQ